MKSVLVVCVLIMFGAADKGACGQLPERGRDEAQRREEGVQTRVVGDVTAVGVSDGRVTVRTEAGRLVTVTVGKATRVLRVPPGQAGQENAVAITLAEIGVGERLFARGAPSADGVSLAASQLVVSRAKDGGTGAAQDGTLIFGHVTALNPAAKEITARMRAAEGAELITLDASGDVVFLRYAPDSVNARDAVPGTFADLRVGDRLRARGERLGDGARFRAAEIISGTIVRLAGVVKSVNASAGEVTIHDDLSGKRRVVRVGGHTMLRRVPTDVASGLLPPAAGEGTPQGAADTRPPVRSLQELFESLPTITPGELRKGDQVLVTATARANGSHLTAVALMTGDPTFMSHLRRLQSAAGREGRGDSPGLPSDVIGGGIGVRDDSNPPPP